MSLKGYQWLNDEGKVIMSYMFKDRILDVWKDITEKDMDEFKEYLNQNECEVANIEMHNESKIIN